MDSYPLPKLLQEISEWCNKSEFPFGVHILWTDKQLQILVNYFSDVEVDANFSSKMHKKLCLHEAWEDRFKPQSYTRATQHVVSFLQDLSELFKVPKLQHLSHIHSSFKKNELVAGFVSFLLQLLHPQPRFLALNAFPDVETRVAKELRFLVTILGDAPFRAVEHEQVQTILTEFEQVANEAGTLLHCLIFIQNKAVTTMNEAISALLEDIKLLKDNIVKFLHLLPNIVVIPTANYDLESLFIVGSLQRDLEDLINRDDRPLVEVEDQIKILHQRLIVCQSLLRVPQHMQIEKLQKEPIVQLMAVSYDAEYLINSFLVGD